MNKVNVITVIIIKFSTVFIYSLTQCDLIQKHESFNSAINPSTAENKTLSNARQFYSSIGDALSVNELIIIIIIIIIRRRRRRRRKIMIVIIVIIIIIIIEKGNNDKCITPLTHGPWLLQI